MEVLMNELIKYIGIAVVFMIFDVITGLWQAISNGTYKSSVMREGGKHKVTLILVVLFGVLLDYAQTQIDIGFSIPATLLICLYIIVMEIGSCKENIKKAYDKAIPDALEDAIDDAVEKVVNKDEG